MFHNGYEPIIYEAGGFYQPANTEEVLRRRAAAEPFIAGERPSEDLELQAYQEWVELDWKTPHGSYSAVERLMDKLVEEAGLELVYAERELRETAETEQPGRLAAFESEAGDALWCTVAVASNAGVNITQAARLYLRKWYLHPDPVGPITFGNLEAKLKAHKPAHVIDPHFLPDGCEAEDFIPNIATYLTWFSVSAGNALDRQYGYNERPDWVALSRFLQEITEVRSPEAVELINAFAKSVERAGINQGDVEEIETHILEGYHKYIADKYVYPLIGDGIVFLEYAARERNLPLGEIAIKNMQKISGRVQAKTVDKSDGERSLLR